MNDGLLAAFCGKSQQRNMNTSHNVGLRLRAYFQAIIFLLPAVFIWGFSTVFLFPKLKTILRDAGVTSSKDTLIDASIFFMQASDFVTEHSVVICFAIILLLIFLEWRVNGWARYRRVSIGMMVFFLNSVVLVLMAMMLASAL